MSEHLSPERISLLLDEPGSREGGEEHLASCEACAREYERMSRMRMALSALPELEPPADGWDRLRRELGPGTGAQVRVLAFPGRFRPVWAAAVIAGLFAAGLGVGRALAPGGAGTGPVAGLADVGPAGPGGTTATADSEYLRALARLDAMRVEAFEPAANADPALVAERLMKLDALVEASREALRSAPADPVLNNFLFDVVDQRERVADDLDRTLRLASVEY